MLREKSKLTNSSVLELVIELWHKLYKKRKRQLYILFFLILLSGLSEVLSLATVLPFLAVLANPNAIWSNSLVQQSAKAIGIDSPGELILPVTLLFIFSAIISGAIRILNLWLSGRVVAAITSDLSSEAYKRILSQPYSSHIKVNSSELIASLSLDMNTLKYQVLIPLLTLISSGTVGLSLIITLLLIDFNLTFSLGLSITILYSLIIYLNKRSIERLSQSQVYLERNLIKTLQESLGSIREIILESNQVFFSTIHFNTDHKLRRVQAKKLFQSGFPRFILEPLAMVLIAIAGCWLVMNGGVTKALPLLGALALGSQRLLPMAQKFYESSVACRGSKSSLENVICLINKPLPNNYLKNGFKKLCFKDQISFNNVSFKYDAGASDILSNFSLKIRRGEKIGVIGTSGSGKSTAIDLLMGLLEPTNGEIHVDGKNLHDTMNKELLSSWKAGLSHVPQNIFLTDTTISENIAFGIDPKNIDMKRVEYVASKAQIAGFIESLPDGYNSSVGERGISLSGGQRQRIAIARALYKDVSLLILDEATSALDNQTEALVVDAITSMKKDLTIVMVAHRLSTLEKCDRVIDLRSSE